MDSTINNTNQYLKAQDLQIPPPELPEIFERLCLDLYRKEYGERTQKNGSSGQAQNGVDIFVIDQYIGIQCKKKEYSSGKISKEALQSEVEKAKTFKPQLKRFILATTCKRDAKIQQEARIISEHHKQKNLFSVDIHSWQEIKELLEKYHEVYNKYYSNQFAHKTSYQSRDYLSSYSVKSVEITHAELNRIRDLIQKQPSVAFDLLEKIKKDNWTKLNKIDKYKVLTNMGCAKINMNRLSEGASLLIQALQFNKEDEDALSNYAIACLINNELDTAKKYLKKVKKLNPLNILAHVVDIKVQNKENIPIDAIIKNLPTPLRKNDEIARTLFDINLDKKNYQEANKWYKTFQENKPNDVESNLIDATMSLRKILNENDDIYYFRCVPDKFRSEIQRIIKVYDSIILNDEYQKYDPNLYMNYAIALELNGEIDKATNILKQFKTQFQDNNKFINELIRLLMRKGCIKEVTKIINNTSDEKKSCFMYIVLSDIKCQEGKLEEGIKTLKKAYNLLSIKGIDKDIIQQSLILKLIKLNKLEEAKKELDIFYQLNKKNPVIYIFKSQIAGKEKDKTRQIDYLREALYVAQNNDKNYEFLLLLIEELIKNKMYNKCEPLLEKVINNNLNNPNIFSLLHVYFESGNYERAISLAKKLTEKFPHRIEPFNYLFLIYENLGDRSKAIEYYEKYLTSNPDDNLVKIELMKGYILNEQLSEAEEILKIMLDNIDQLSRLDSRFINPLTRICSKLGYWKEAIEIQYESIKNNPKNPELQNGYIFLFFNKKEPLPKLDKITVDCYVKIKELQSNQEKEIIIENNADIFTPDHELSKKLLGKSIKDIIFLKNKEYQIIDIKSKYLYRHYEILNNIETYFPLKSGVQSVHVPQPLNLVKLTERLKTVMPNISQDTDFLNKVLTEYQQSRMTIGTIAYCTKKHPIEVMKDLSSPFNNDFKFLSSVGNENDEEAFNILDNNQNIVIDLSSLMTIHWIKISEYLEKSSFNLYICQSTIDSLNEIIQKNQLHAKDGLTTIFFR